MHAVIAGAGPAGLVSALILAKEGIKVTMYERASEEKLFQDVGSGYDITVTTVKIFQELGLLDEEPLRSSLASPTGYRFYNADDGNMIRSGELNSDLKNASPVFDGYFMQRSKLQKTILRLLESQDSFKLVCNAKVVEYREEEGGDLVVKVDQNGKTSLVVPDVLLACDGIHSAIRAHMHSDKHDPMHFCNCHTWWGRTDIAATKLPKNLGDMLEENGEKPYVIAQGKGKNFFAGVKPSEDVAGGFTFMWAVTQKAGALPEKDSQIKDNQTDLTKRGGVSGNTSKSTALEALGNNFQLGRDIINATKPECVTKCGLFDRENLNLKYVQGRVALLGDAAHPQTPMMGQGANMAICDAFCVAKRLSMVARLSSSGNTSAQKDRIRISLEEYDNDLRRDGAAAVIKQARTYANWMVSDSFWIPRIIMLCLRFMPITWLSNDFEEGDKVNKKALETLDKDILQYNINE